MVDIIKVTGEDPLLYELVGPLVMNEDVLAYNLNYPFRTSSSFLWFIAIGNGHTLGFIPVKLGRSKAKINNYYVADDDNEVFSALLQEINAALLEEYELEAITQLRHVPEFEKNGFTIALNWKRYAKMIAV
ncbi:MAG: hypothetical protein LBU44_00475 [Mediterranea sp.]|jgi:hypothetical protein|nr:hypothetical protein [Mediterranea sp.]